MLKLTERLKDSGIVIYFGIALSIIGVQHEYDIESFYLQDSFLLYIYNQQRYLIITFKSRASLGFSRFSHA